MAGFDLFGNAQKKDIRVGYISTDRGYVSNVSVYEANRYAKLEPGTQFIVSNRDEVKYLNINEVNALTPEDVTPSNTPSNCGGIDGLNPSIDLGKVNKIEVNFLGGGGVGAQANAVVGSDGSILAVDLIHGGFGYKYPPLVEIKDTFGIASKVNAQAFLGDTAILLETYTDEDEFENLDLETLIPNYLEDEYGVRLDPVNGQVVGNWNPNDYANYFQDPIRSEIKKYQEFVQRKSTGTWWDTRSQKPLSVFGEDKNNNVIFPVDHWSWGGDLLKPEKNTGLVPVEFEVYGQGSRANRDIEFKFEADDGSHSFTVRGITNQKNVSKKGRTRKTVKRVRVNTTYIITSNSRKKVKNIDRSIEQGLVREEGGKSVERGPGKGNVIFADYVGSRDDNDDMQLTAERGKFKAKNPQTIKATDKDKSSVGKGAKVKEDTYDLTYRLSFRDPTKRNPIEVVEETFMNKYAISPVPESEAEGSAKVGKVYTFIWQEYFPYDGEYTFNALADSFSNINFSNSEGTLWDFVPGQIKGLRNNRKNPVSITKTVREGLYTITATIENGGEDPEIKTVVTPPAVINQKPKENKESGDVEYKIAYIGLSPVNNKIDVSSNRKTIKFYDEDGDDPNAHLEILSGKAVFSKNGNELIGKGTVKLKFRWDDDPKKYGLAVKQVQIIQGGNNDKILGSNRNFNSKKGDDTQTLTMESSKSQSDSTNGSKSGRGSSSPYSIFDTSSSMGKADRKLYRAKPILGKKVSGFFNKYAVLPFDPQGEKIKSVSETPKAFFENEGGNLYLKITGSGRMKIDFEMKVDDNLQTSGLALREVRIETDTDLLTLRRDIREINVSGDDDDLPQMRLFENQNLKIKGSGEFTAGKRYSVKQIGGSSTSGFKQIDKTKIGFDDNIDNGFDNNADLKITNTKVLGKENSSTTYSTESYAGEHLIRWENVEFPQDGNYTIRAAADDSAKIFIGNVSGKGKIGIGNGLKSREKGGDEYVMNVGATEPKVEGAFFTKGKYRLRVELTQERGKTLQSGNPMGIAIEIRTASSEQQVEVDNTESWQENPLGLALTINAPVAPIPKETPPPQEGRCPNNPMWTTRFTQGSNGDNWYPAYDNRWETFMNRFAMSPVKPKSSPESSESGKEFSKTWNIDVPYDGFYGVKGACDNTGTITVGGATFNLESFSKPLPTLNKVFLNEGRTNIIVRVTNAAQQSFVKKPKVIFDTADWVNSAEEIDTEIIKEKIVCHAGGGYGGESGGVQKKVGKVKKGKGGRGARGEGEQDGEKGGNGGGAGLRNGKSAKTGKGGTIDGGFGVDLKGSERGTANEIRSATDDGGKGAKYGAGGGGNRGTGNAGDGANGAVKIVWGSTGKSQTWTEPGVYEVLVPQTEPGKLNRTSVRMTCIGGGGSGYTDRAGKSIDVKVGEGEGTGYYYDSDGRKRSLTVKTDVRQKMVKGGGGGSGAAYAYATEKCVAGTKLEIVVGKGGLAALGREEGSSDGEDSYVKILTTVIDKEAEKPKKVKNPQGSGKIKYIGPLITSYKKKSFRTSTVDKGTKRKVEDHLGPYLSPFFAFGRQATDEIQGREWKFTWENVDFPIDGRYTFRTEADDKMVVRIDGKKVQTTEVFENIEEKTKRFTKGKKTVEITLENSNQPGTNFVLNPVYCGLEILAQVPTEINDQSSWKKNPVGASAILIPPPCPQRVGGIGIITDVSVTTPGVGYTATSGPGYPVTLILDEIVIENPGINYTPTDPVIVFGGYDTDTDIPFPPNEPIPPGLPFTGPIGPGITPGSPGSGLGGVGDGYGGGADGTGGTGDGDPGVATFDPNVPGLPTTDVGLTGDPSGTGGGGSGTGGDGVDDEGFSGGTGQPSTSTPGSTPGSGAPLTVSGVKVPELSLITGPFGAVVGVKIVDPGSGFTKTPTISVLSDTGVNAVLRPKFRIVRDPIGVDPQTLIQVTDLVGLKQTGYIDGRAYYGQVFINNGLRYAGVYETVGELVRVYDTLQESITGEVTTRPSAILRQGTDIQSNDPRLNLPGTPDNLT